MADREYRARRVEQLSSLKDECDREEADEEQCSQSVTELASAVSAAQQKVNDADQAYSEAQGALWDIEPAYTQADTTVREAKLAYEAANEAFVKEKLRYAGANERVKREREAQQIAYDEIRCKKEQLQGAKDVLCAKKEQVEQARKAWEEADRAPYSTADPRAMAHSGVRNGSQPPLREASSINTTGNTAVQAPTADTDNASTAALNATPKDCEPINKIHTHILLREGRWYEHFCRHCGCNATVHHYYFFRGKEGFYAHVKSQHSVDITTSTTLDHCTRRELSERDVKLLQQPFVPGPQALDTIKDQLEVKIRFVFCKEQAEEIKKRKDNRIKQKRESSESFFASFVSAPERRVSGKAPRLSSDWPDADKENAAPEQVILELN